MTVAVLPRDNGEMVEIGPEERALLVGDLGALKPEQRASLVVKICESVGLNPLTRPFEYIMLNNKLTLYARKDATEQLRRRHTVSLAIVGRENVQGVFVVTARATMPNARTDESIGAVPIAGLKGEAMANAIMKAETKAKRRVTLSICGLGMLDETELETIPPSQMQAVSDERPAGVTIEGDAFVGLPAEMIDEILAVATELGGDAAGLAKAVHAVSEGTTETLANLLPEQGAKLLRVLQKKLAAKPKPVEEVLYCQACGTQTSPQADAKPHEANCPEDDGVL